MCSLVAFLVALAALHRLTVLELGAAAARRTVLLLAFFPTALFFSAAYTEALFLALSVGVFLAAREERWAVAGVLGALGAATRSGGGLLLGPVAVMYFASPEPRRRPWRGGAPWPLLIPCGLAASPVACPALPPDAPAPWAPQ